MNFEDIIGNMNPQMLSNALKQMGNMLSTEQIRQVETAIKNTDKGTLNQKLNSLNITDLQRELRSNPELAKQLADNPELMKKINGVFKK